MKTFVFILAFVGWLVCVLFSIPALLAGFGLRKLARGLLTATFIALVGGIVVSMTAYGAFAYINSSDSWGSGVLVEPTLKVGAVAAPILFGLSTWRRVHTKRITLERTRKSPALIGVGGGMTLVFCFSLYSVVAHFVPSVESTQSLTYRASAIPVISEAPTPVVHQILINRGAEAVPVIIEVITKCSASLGNKPADFDTQRVANLLRLLGKIGGPQALNELRSWLQRDSPYDIRVAAAVALAEHGDRDLTPIIASLLKDQKGPYWRHQHMELVLALGLLKASNEVETIRTAMHTNKDEVDLFIVFPGISALAAIDTDEAWAAIEETSAAKSVWIRGMVVSALGAHPSRRAIPILARALDASNYDVRQRAYEALLGVDPSLQDQLDRHWSEANATRLRTLLKLDSPKPSGE